MILVVTAITSVLLLGGCASKDTARPPIGSLNYAGLRGTSCLPDPSSNKVVFGAEFDNLTSKPIKVLKVVAMDLKKAKVVAAYGRHVGSGTFLGEEPLPPADPTTKQAWTQKQPAEGFTFAPHEDAEVLVEVRVDQRSASAHVGGVVVMYKTSDGTEYESTTLEKLKVEPGACH